MSGISNKIQKIGIRRQTLTETSGFLIAVLPWFIMAIVMFPRLDFGATDLRIIEAVFGGRDQAYIAGTMWRAWERGLPIYGSLYGDLYFNIAWLLLWIGSLFTTVTQHTVIFMLRSISLVSYLAIGVISYIWFRRFSGIIGAFIYSTLFFLLSANSDFIFRTTACQPDMLNLTFCVLTFFACLELSNNLNRRWLYIASISAGLVMAVKYSGILFLPLIGMVLLVHSTTEKFELIDKHSKNTETVLKWLFIALVIGLVCLEGAAIVLLQKGYHLKWLPIPTNWPRLTGIFMYIGIVVTLFIMLKLASRMKMRKINYITRGVFWFEAMTLVILLFFLAFGLSSPGSFLGLRFVSNLTQHSNVISSSAGTILLWVRFIYFDALGPFLSILVCAGSFIVALKVYRNRSKTLTNYDVIALIWLIVVVCFIMIYVGKVRERFLFPVFPAAVFFSTIPVLKIVDALRNQTLKVIGVVSIILVLLLSAGGLISVEAQRTKNDFSDIDSMPSVQVGKWLLKSNFKKDVNIFLDAGAYIPYKFKNIRLLSVGNPYKQVESFDPDIVILNNKFIRHFAELKNEDFDEIYRSEAGVTKRFYADLLESRLPFKKVAVFSGGDDMSGFVVLGRIR
jgi:4-amino-4-deoxy-L-arabinose transferase-like glycosyltransferase